MATKKTSKKNPCWKTGGPTGKGYEAKGTKMKNGKKVPNCVPKK